MKTIKIIIKILFILLIIGWIFGMFADYSRMDDKDIYEDRHVTIGKDPVIKDNISISYYWLVSGEKLDTKHVIPVDKTIYKDLKTDKKFVFAIFSIENKSNVIKNVTLDNLSFKSDDGGVYSPYTILGREQKVESVIDKNNENILVSEYGVMRLTIEPWKEEKRAILFEIPKEINSGVIILKQQIK